MLLLLLWFDLADYGVSTDLVFAFILNNHNNLCHSLSVHLLHLWGPQEVFKLKKHRLINIYISLQLHIVRYLLFIHCLYIYKEIVLK